MEENICELCGKELGKDKEKITRIHINEDRGWIIKGSNINVHKECLSKNSLPCLDVKRLFLKYKDELYVSSFLDANSFSLITTEKQIDAIFDPGRTRFEDWYSKNF